MKSESSCYPCLQLKCRKWPWIKTSPGFDFQLTMQWAVRHYLKHCPYGLKLPNQQHLNSPSSIIPNRIYKVVLFKGSGHGNQMAILAYSTWDLLQGSRIKTSAPELPPPLFCVATVSLYVRSDSVIKTNSYPKKILIKECLMLFLMKYYSPPFYGLYLPAWSLQRNSEFCLTGKAFVLQYTQKC